MIRNDFFHRRFDDRHGVGRTLAVIFARHRLVSGELGGGKHKVRQPLAGVRDAVLKKNVLLAVGHVPGGGRVEVIADPVGKTVYVGTLEKRVQQIVELAAKRARGGRRETGVVAEVAAGLRAVHHGMSAMSLGMGNL